MTAREFYPAAMELFVIQMKNEPNEALQRIRLLVTNRTFPHSVRARFAPSNRITELERWQKRQ